MTLPIMPALLESVDTEWDRISAGKGAAEYLLPARTRSRSALRGAEGADRVVSRLCAGAALVIRGQTFGFGGHAALK
jgi:hypothetical protein